MRHNWSKFFKFILLFAFIFCFSDVYSQNGIVKGKVKDDTGLEMPGVAIYLVGATNVGTVTDLDGNYSIRVKDVKNPVLRFSYVGFKTEDVPVKGRNLINLTMSSDVSKLDEVVVVGYGTQKRISITGAVNSVKADQLSLASSSSLATALTGRLPGTVIVQNSGVAGAKVSDISIRGASNNPLILVDGVERSFEDLDMDEIESISVLKDASATAVYGIRGGDGVIIITTKRGQEGKFKVNLKTEYGLLQRSKMPQMLDSYNYALMQNEGHRNDNGISLDDDTYTEDLYSQNDLDLYKSGLSPLTHPSHNWSDYLTNEFGNHQRYNLSISGGNKMIKSYTTIGYMAERDIYKSYNVGYDNDSKYNRYNLRTNIDLNISKTTVLSVDLSGQFSNRHKPTTDFNDLTKNMLITPPNVGTLYNGKVISTISDIGDSPLRTLYDVGYNDNHTNRLQLAMKFKQNLDVITKGLSFDATGSYDHAFTNNYTASRSVPIYIPGFTDPISGNINYTDIDINPETMQVRNPWTKEWTDLSNIELLRNGTESKLSGSRSTGTSYKNINFKARLNYSRDFGKHHVGALGVYTINSKSYHSSSYSYVPLRYMELATRLSYNYDSKYFIEFNGGYNGSETFAKENRFGFFPAVSGGWVITNESFFPKNKILTFAKVRGSYGTTGIDKGINRFMYFDVYNLSYTGGYLFGSTPNGLGIATQKETGNMEVKWATNYQKNVALETKWFSDKLKLNVDIFRNDKKGIMMEPQSVPSIVASQLPAANLKHMRYEGYEISTAWQDKIGKVSYNLFANYNYANAKNVFIDEVKPEYSWQVQTGKNPNQLYGFNCLGFYTQEDINYLSEHEQGTKDIPKSSFGKVQAGDLKYEDLNGDGLIDNNDKMYFENTATPKTTFGFGGGLKYGNFGLNIFFQGVDDVTYSINGLMRVAFQSGRCNGADYILKRWTQDRYNAGEEILFPRMSAVGTDKDNNYQSSNFWMRDASYIRLKNVELSYKLQNNYLKKIGVKGLNITLSGTNLLTFSNLKIVDPETKSGDSVPIPPNKVYTLGLNFSF